jgi:ABC-type transport system involved in cytochrome bd biosynthesis fused ATPase/permease subunit
MNLNKIAFYLNISLLLLTIFSIVFIGIFHIPYGKTIFFSLYAIIIIACFIVDRKIKKYEKDK